MHVVDTVEFNLTERRESKEQGLYKNQINVQIAKNLSRHARAT